MSIIENLGICRLGGFVGSNPELLSTYPPSSLAPDSEKEFIEKSLPHGVEPGHIALEKLGNRYLVSYIFSVKSSDPACRDDLASIAVVVPGDVNIADFQELFKIVVEAFKNEIESLNDPDRIFFMLERIYKGVNKSQKIKLKNGIIDVPGIIKERKLKVIREKKSLAGRVL